MNLGTLGSGMYHLMGRGTASIDGFVQGPLNLSLSAA